MILGSIIGTQLGVLLNVFQSLPLPAVWGWFLSSDPVSYSFSVLAGSGFIAVALLLCTKPETSEV